jgi:hypothetical protein
MGGVAPTLLEGKPDEEPWISASWLDEGVGKAAARFHVHGKHVDLSDVVVEVNGGVCWGERGTTRDEMSSGTLGSVPWRTCCGGTQRCGSEVN